MWQPFTVRACAALEKSETATTERTACLRSDAIKQNYRFRLARAPTSEPSARLPTVSAMSAQPPSEDPTQQYNPQAGGQPPEGGGKNPWPWVLGAIAIIVAGVIAAILITGGNDSGSSTDASVTTPVTTLTTKTATSTPTTTTTASPTTTTTTTAPINITRTCTVSNIPGVVGNSTTATVNATNVPSSQTALASCSAASALVKGVARTQAEQPVTVQGSSCTPSVSGSTAKWSCVEHGADSALTITTKFPLTYTN